MFQRTAQWMFPNPNYHRFVPDGDRWAMRHLPFYGRWFRFLTFYPGAGLTIEGSRIDPAFDDGDGLAISERNRATRDVFWRMISTQLADHPALLAKVLPDYPVTAKRMLQDNGSWLDCLKTDNVELVRTGIDRIVADGVITEDGAFHAADIICYATGSRHGSLIFQSESQMHYIMGAPRTARRRPPNARTPPRHTRRLQPAVPGRDRTDGVGTLVGQALALQERRRTYLHLVAMADPDLLALDIALRTERLRLHLIGRVATIAA